MSKIRCVAFVVVLSTITAGAVQALPRDTRPAAVSGGGSLLEDLWSWLGRFMPGADPSAAERAWCGMDPNGVKCPGPPPPPSPTGGG